jgi:hypothetical protein
MGRRAWMQPNGDTLFAQGTIKDGTDIEVWRGGAWTKLGDAKDVAYSEIETVLEHEGAFWFTSGGDLYRESSGRIEKVNQKEVSIGLMETKDGLSLLYSSWDAPKELLQATVSKGAHPAFRWVDG